MMIQPTLVMPETFEDCLTYAKQLRKLYEEYLKVSGGGDPSVISDLQKQVNNLTQQITEITNEIENLDIANISENLDKLTNEITELQKELLNKQNTLTFDVMPTENSENPVTSNGIYVYLNKMNDELLKSINQKENTTDVDNKIKYIVDNYVTDDDITERLNDYETTAHASETYATKTNLSDYETTTHASETYATKDNLTDYETVEHAKATYATKEELQDIDLSGYVKEEELNNYETTAHASETYATKTSLSDYETTAHASETYATKTSLSDYETTAHASETYATKTSLSDYETTAHASETYATKTSLSDYETTAHASETYATKENLTDYETVEHAKATYATKEEISNIDLDDYATKASLSDYETIEHAKATYATKEELQDIDLEGYVKEEELNNYETTAHASETYATKTSLSDYETTAHATETYATKEDLQNVHIEVDENVSSNSQNPVTSKGIYDFVIDQTVDLATIDDLNSKQNTLTFDNTPTLNSTNPVTSGGVYDSIKNVDGKFINYTTHTDFNNYKTDVDETYLSKDEASATYPTLQFLATELENYETTGHAENTYVTKVELENYTTKTYSDNTYAKKSDLETKQNILTFDTQPTEGSTNPVTSDGIYKAISSGTSEATKIGQCRIGYSDSTTWNYNYTQTLEIYTTDKIGASEITAYCDFDIDFQYYNNFTYLLADSFSPSISYASGSEQVDGYGVGYADFSLKIDNHYYIGDIIAVGFKDSSEGVYAFSVKSGAERLKRYFIDLSNATAKTLTKGHISFRLRLLI